MRPLIFLQLNELNVDLVIRYINEGEMLPNFSKFLAQGVKFSSSEERYRELEPWIQWRSVHTGRTFADHGVFRLGDAIHDESVQIFEAIEEMGFIVGAMSPMNANNNLKRGFFVPDPWTETNPDSSLISKWLTDALRQGVNDNSEARITLETLAKLCFAALAVLPLRELWSLSLAAITSVTDHVRKTLWLDRLLAMIFIQRTKDNSVDFGVLFLNGVAHLQHHYLHASRVLVSQNELPTWYVSKGRDPVLESYKEYDRLLGKIEAGLDADFLIATALSQESYPKPVYYYRLLRHEDFLKKLDIRFSKVRPRMTRDFLVECDSEDDLLEAIAKLKEVSLFGESLFNVGEAKGRSVFVELSYHKEIKEHATCQLWGRSIPVGSEVTFVALKNGHHRARGYVLASSKELLAGFDENDHVKALFDTCVGRFRRKERMG